MICTAIQAESKVALQAEIINRQEATLLSAQQFWQAWRASEVSKQQEAAAYAMGVWDATEGKSWCSYRNIKPHVLYERLFNWLGNQATEVRMREPAVLHIEAAVKQHRACSKKNPVWAQKPERDLSLHQNFYNNLSWAAYWQLRQQKPTDALQYAQGVRDVVQQKNQCLTFVTGQALFDWLDQTEHPTASATPVRAAHMIENFLIKKQPCQGKGK